MASRAITLLAVAASASILVACDIQSRPGKLPRFVNCDTDAYQTATLDNSYTVSGSSYGTLASAAGVARLKAFADRQQDVCARHAYREWANYLGRREPWRVDADQVKVIQSALPAPSPGADFPIAAPK